MTIGEGYTPVKAGDIVSPNPDEGAAARGPTFNWGSIMPFVVCILLTAVTVTAALFFGQYETLLRGTPRAADDVSASQWTTEPQPTEKPQVVAHIREYTYDEDAPPGSHYHVPVPQHLHHHDHYDHYYTAVDNGPPLRFDCMASVDSWQRDWSNHKKQWCCTHDDPKFCAETTIDCTSHPSTWTKSQEEWCKWHDREHVQSSKDQYYHGIRPFYAWPHHSTHHYSDEHYGDQWYYGAGHKHPIGPNYVHHVVHHVQPLNYAHADHYQYAYPGGESTGDSFEGEGPIEGGVAEGDVEK